jgi:hypothetical protein
MLMLGLSLALVVGLVMGLLGAGGSILTVPIFVYLLGFEAKQAIAMSLAVVGATSLVGAVRHGRLGNVNLRIALIFGPIAMLGTYVGARLSVFFSGTAQLALFGAVMLAASFFMLRDHHPAPSEGRLPAVALALVVLGALGVGMLTGLAGVGGGFLIVPVFILLLRLPVKQAVGTSLLVIALKSFAGFGGYLTHVEVAWGFIGGFAAIAIAGIWIGTYLLQFLSPHAIKRVFGIFLLVMGVWILYQNRGAFELGSRDPLSSPAVGLSAPKLLEGEGSESPGTPGQNWGDVFTAETAEGAEMNRVAQEGPPASSMSFQYDLCALRVLRGEMVNMSPYL